MLNLTINLQKVFTEKSISLPAKSHFKKWIAAALPYAARAIPIKQPEITIRIVDPPESAALNFQFRHKPTPTNVLSFPQPILSNTVNEVDDLNLDTALEDTNTTYLGDLVICAAIVKQEAEEQHKTFTAHLVHLVIHGTLHLLGYVHDNKKNAKIMEAQEIKILEQLGYNNPYDDEI